MHVHRTYSPESFRINSVALSSYRKQLDEIAAQSKTSDAVPLGQLLLLPGVVDEEALSSEDVQQDWPVLRKVLDEALENLTAMRAEEGRTMYGDLKANCDSIVGDLTAVESRAPLVVDGYRSRLEERIKRLLADHEITLDPSDLIREVSIFAERSDISEEIVRLRSHVEQFVDTLNLDTSSGRKLEFLTQEMVRESNTIGSKANDVEIARHVIEIKSAIERIREMIQNVE